MSDDIAPCQCPEYNAACTRAGRPMTVRQWEICGDRCPEHRPCNGWSERFRRGWDRQTAPSEEAPEKKSKLLTCRFRGEATGEVRLCGG